jgi:structural maintenance of chromosome 2
MKQVTSIKQDYDQAESELNVGRSKLKECDSQINRMAKEQQKLQQKLSDSNVERKKMENEVVPGSSAFCTL